MGFKKIKKQKAATAEFTERQLPQTRRQQFFDCVKVRCPLFLRVGVTLFAFLLPCFLLYIYRDFNLMSFNAQLGQGAITREEYLQAASSVNLIAAAINIVCLTIASIGFAGVARVVRQLIWGEPVFYMNDFVRGIKSDWKAFTAVFFLAGMVRFINTVAGSFQFPVEIIKYLPYGVSVIFLLPLALFFLSQTTVYKNRVFVSLKNSCTLYVKSAPLTLVFILALAVSEFVGLIPLVFIKYTVFIVLNILVLPLFLLAWELFSFNLFDKFINKEQFPELYRRGLYTPH